MKPYRQGANGGGRAYSLITRNRDLVSDNQSQTVERNGYQISVAKNPFWNASVNLGAPFFIVEAYGKDKEGAISNCLARVAELKERAA